MKESLKQDLIGLTEYILEMEYKDMIEVLIDEPSYLEEGIITKEQIEELQTVQRESEIVYKCCLNPLNLHIYALSYRIWNGYLKS